MPEHQSKSYEKERQRNDTGFGTNTTSRKARLIQKDGSFNVKRQGQSFQAWLNLYNRLITMSWSAFFGVIFMFYFFVNLFFASIYSLIGIENLQGALETEVPDFWAAFFFSSQTLTTVGYGHISPVGMPTSSIAAIEAMVGLMLFALITGLLYGRFSRPNPKILFSKQAIISPYLDINGFMFRIINERSNQLLNVSTTLILSRNEKNDQGQIVRRYYDLELERSFIRYFATNWTIVHPIDEQSPLYHISKEQMEADDYEFLVTVDGTDDTFSDPVHVRHSYLYNEILRGKKFKPILEQKNDYYTMDIHAIDDMEDRPLN